MNHLTGEASRLNKEKETFEHTNTQKDQQISQITEANQETLKQLVEQFEIIKGGVIGLTKELETLRQENYDHKLREIQRKKDEDIAKIHSAIRATQPSPQEIHDPPQEPHLDEIDSKEENNTSVPWDKIALTSLVIASSVLKGYLEGKKYNSLSPPSQSAEPRNIPHSNQTNQKKNIIQPGIYGIGRGVGLGPGIGLWAVIPSFLKNYMRKT